MSETTKKFNQLFDLEEIDDFNLASVEQNHLPNNINNTLVMRDNDNYDYSEYNLMLRNDGNQYLTSPGNYHPLSTGFLSSDLTSNADSLSSDLPSAADSLSSASNMDFFSSDLASPVVLPTSSAPSAVSLPVKQLLNGMIRNKLRTEGRLDTSMTSSPKDSSFDQLTPDEEKKKLEKQQRNKESARKSRQKKKEEEEKLLKDNESLTVKKGKLQTSVKDLTMFNRMCEDFLANHPCIMSPQQDNGDKICVETGRNKVCGDDVNSGDAESKMLETALELMTVYDIPANFGQGSESQRKKAILCELGDNYPSKTVTSLTAYEPKRGLTANANYSGIQESGVGNISFTAKTHEELKTASVGYSSIQETAAPNNSNTAQNHEELKTRDGAINGKFPAGSSVGYDTQIFNAESVHKYQAMSHGRLPISGEVTRNNSWSVSMMKSNKQNINPWSTEDNNKSEEDEALKFFHNISPPPVKKFKYE